MVGVCVMGGFGTFPKERGVDAWMVLDGPEVPWYGMQIPLVRII